MSDKKSKYITIIIGICAFILSWLCGLVISSIVLCVGTALIYARTDNVWKYPLITLIGNAFAGIVACVLFLLTNVLKRVQCHIQARGKGGKQLHDEIRSGLDT